jgi:Gram-negative bacterial TonB protein C-terminal
MLQASAQLQKRISFIPPGVLSANDVSYPLNTTAEGIIVFHISLSASGEITNMNALTDVPPLTNVAELSLRSWRFSPASYGGKMESSQMLVSFVFRHALNRRNPPLFNPVFAPRVEEGYMPVAILSAAYADYPSSTIAAGATIVQVTIKADGMIGGVKAVRPLKGGFVPLAVKTAKNWQFESAMWNGTPVTSKTDIAFVFSSRATNPF